MQKALADSIHYRNEDGIVPTKYNQTSYLTALHSPTDRDFTWTLKGNFVGEILQVRYMVVFETLTTCRETMDNKVSTSATCDCRLLSYKTTPRLSFKKTIVRGVYH
jgi:hypothetical protein